MKYATRMIFSDEVFPFEFNTKKKKTENSFGTIRLAHILFSIHAWNRKILHHSLITCVQMSELIPEIVASFRCFTVWYRSNLYFSFCFGYSWLHTPASKWDSQSVDGSKALFNFWAFSSVMYCILDGIDSILLSAQNHAIIIVFFPLFCFDSHHLNAVQTEKKYESKEIICDVSLPLISTFLVPSNFGAKKPFHFF